MDVDPVLDIYFGDGLAEKLQSAMAALAKPPWSRAPANVFGRKLEGYLDFRRARTGVDPDCILTIHVEGPGHWKVVSIVPEQHEHYEIDHKCYVRLLREFNEVVAAPATEQLGGQTVMGADKHTLSDHFSPRAVELLESFCQSANLADRGRHENDQHRWRRFLIFVHRNNESVHCDIFGRCLEATGWWPKDDIDELTSQYDFAQSLLKQSDETSRAI